MISHDVLLEARGIGRRVPTGDGWLLRDIWLQVRPAERYALVGPSGSGKTLLLRALALLDVLDAGEIYWRGQPVPNEAVPGFRRQVIYVHQRPALFEGSVEDNLRKPFTLKAHRASRFDRKRIEDLLVELGREASFLHKSHHELSGGEAQIVAVLRAVQLDPAVLLLDEPTAALDPESSRSIERLIDRWLGEVPGTRALLWVSHNLAQAERVAGRSLVMRGGTLEGKKEDESVVR